MHACQIPSCLAAEVPLRIVDSFYSSLRRHVEAIYLAWHDQSLFVLTTGDNEGLMHRRSSKYTLYPFILNAVSSASHAFIFLLFVYRCEELPRPSRDSVNAHQENAPNWKCAKSAKAAITSPDVTSSSEYVYIFWHFIYINNNFIILKNY